LSTYSVEKKRKKKKIRYNCVNYKVRADWAAYSQNYGPDIQILVGFRIPALVLK
jgi:hypothetical protein